MRGNRWRLGRDFRRDAMSIGNAFRCQVRVSNAGTGEAGRGIERATMIGWFGGSDRRAPHREPHQNPRSRMPPQPPRVVLFAALPALCLCPAAGSAGGTTLPTPTGPMAPATLLAAVGVGVGRVAGVAMTTHARVKSDDDTCAPVVGVDWNGPQLSYIPSCGATACCCAACTADSACDRWMTIDALHGASKPGCYLFRAGGAKGTAYPGYAYGPAPAPHVTTSKYDELWRPRFHYFAAPHMMDPAAIFEANGLWHLFHDAFRDPLVEIPEWSHATSPDAVHWTKHKVAVPRGVPGACECSNPVFPSHVATRSSDAGRCRQQATRCLRRPGASA